jgi:hypothetical protein
LEQVVSLARPIEMTATKTLMHKRYAAAFKLSIALEESRDELLRMGPRS